MICCGFSIPEKSASCAIATEAELADPNFTADLPIPVEVGGAECVRRAARECDVLVSWGLVLNDWLKDCRPRLSVVLAHGDGVFTRNVLHGCDQVLDHVVAVSQVPKVSRATASPRA